MKILIVCESTYKFESGGRVVRYLAKILNSKNQDFKLLVLDSKRDDYDLDSFYLDNDVTFFPLKRNLRFRLSKLFLRTREIKKFRNVLNEYKPNVVHFASFDNEKPRKFITESKSFGARVILQPWTMHFYCAQGFGFLNGQKCDLCLRGEYWHAISKGCISKVGIPLQIERAFLHKVALKADAFLSSNTELDNLLVGYKAPLKRIYRFPVPFDCSFAQSSEEIEGEYYIFYGQANGHKGLDVLLNVFEKLPNLKLRIYPLSPLDKDLSDRNNIEVINGINWSNGLKDAIINSKAVLIPSLWSTSTEYAMCEALLLKKAVVVFNVGVHKDIFTNKFNAMVVEANDLDGYANALRQLEDDLKLRMQVAKNGFETLNEINDPENVYTKLMAAYKNFNDRI